MGVDLNGKSQQYEDAISIFQSHVDKLLGGAVTSPGIEVKFRSQGDTQTVLFRTSPLGIYVGAIMVAQLPLTVAEIEEDAAAWGIRKGWVVHSIAGVEVFAKSKTYEEVLAHLERLVDNLPDDVELREN